MYESSRPRINDVVQQRPNVDLMLSQRHRWWANIEPTWGQCLTFAGTGVQQGSVIARQQVCVCAEGGGGGVIR